MSEELHSWDNLAEFAGFVVPEANWFPVPNDWFDRWIALRQFAGKGHMRGPLLVMLYLLKHALWKWLKGHPHTITKRLPSGLISRPGGQPAQSNWQRLSTSSVCYPASGFGVTS